MGDVTGMTISVGEGITGVTINVSEGESSYANDVNIINNLNEMIITMNQINSPAMFAEHWLTEFVHAADMDIDVNDFRFKRDQKKMIMRMKKKERRKYLKKLKAFLKS